MLVTGNNPQQNKDLSILIRTDGLSFYIPTTNGEIKKYDFIGLSENEVKEQIDALKAKIQGTINARVVIFLDRFLAMPTELCIKENINQYLSLKGVNVNFDEDYIITSQSGNCTYISLCDRWLIDLINLNFDSVTYTHVLGISQKIGASLCKEFKNDIFIFSKEHELLSVTIFKNNQLVFQEIIEVKTPSDVIFYVKTLLKKFSYKKKDNIITIDSHNDEFNKILLKFSKHISLVDFYELK